MAVAWKTGSFGVGVKVGVEVKEGVRVGGRVGVNVGEAAGIKVGVFVLVGKGAKEGPNSRPVPQAERNRIIMAEGKSFFIMRFFL
jgi:hypothetical protein